MSLTSFLTQSPAINQQGINQTSTQLPQWYSDYASGILSNAAQWGQQGAPIFPGPQVAGLSPDQQSSYGTVAGQQGVGSGIAQQGVNQVQNTLGQPNALQAGSPYLNSSAGGIYGSLGMQNASQAASPYLNAAAQPISGQMGQFMNPYLNQVVNTNNYLTNRQFNEQVLPNLQNQFTQAGQVYGGSNQGVFANQLARNLNLNQLMSNANTLAGGFNTALQGATQQQGLLGSLGSSAGQLANAAQGTNLYGAGLLGSLGSTAGGLANAAQNTGIGGGTALGNLGSTEQNNALNQAYAQNQMGLQQQQQTQANYNAAMNNFNTQFNWPLTASQGMQSALAGIQTPQGISSYNYASPQAGYGLSPIQAGMGTYGGISNLASALGIARGGHIRTYARGGRVVRPLLRMRRKSPLEISCG